MLDKIINRLLTVKSIITLSLTAVFTFLSATGKIAPEAFQDIFYIIVAFYFGSSLERTAKTVGTETE